VRVAPLFPTSEVFEPTLTTVFPVIVPETMTTFLAVPETAAWSAEREVTVVVVPPDPPEVPPFIVAYPTVATSLTDALFSITGEAETSATKARNGAKNFILRVENEMYKTLLSGQHRQDVGFIR
jgi:hypothetical protein